MDFLVNKICSRCVMDQTDAAISFDNYGVCDHCQTFDQKIAPYWKNDRSNFNQFRANIEKMKAAGKGRDFDCIIGMSGGVDSSYLLHLAVTDFDLRPLVFHVDAGWNSQQAVHNIEQIVNKHGLDLYTEVINWEEMKDLQLAFFKSGVPHVDTPQDHAFFATMYKFANKYDVKHILTGGNFSTECIRNPIEWMYYQSDDWQIRSIHARFGARKLETFPLANILWFKVYLPYVRNIKLYRPLDFIEYDKEKAVRILENEYGYQSYKQKHFESRFTRFYESYWLPQKFGYDTRKVQYSSLILTGQMTREEALEKLNSPAHDANLLDDDFQFIANKLDISVDELRGYFNAPNKTYRDYRNQDFLYRFGAKVLRAFGKERGGKR